MKPQKQSKQKRWAPCVRVWTTAARTAEDTYGYGAIHRINTLVLQIWTECEFDSCSWVVLLQNYVRGLHQTRQGLHIGCSRWRSSPARATRGDGRRDGECSSSPMTQRSKASTVQSVMHASSYGFVRCPSIHPQENEESIDSRVRGGRELCPR